ncbi:MAG: methyltransferase [Verrucomicrobia bacterium]|nr:methyltransferase [Verrucomicrobiota bacterium]
MLSLFQKIIQVSCVNPMRLCKKSFPGPALSRLINLGCGSRFHPLWDNYDCKPCNLKVKRVDLTQCLVLNKGQYEACYLSHVLEHLSRSRVPSLLREIQEILSERGVIRIVVPDLEVICQRYLEQLQSALSGDPAASSKHEWMTVELIDQMTRTFSGGYMGRLWWSRPLLAREFILKRLGEEAGKWLNEIDSQIQKGAKPLAQQDVYQTVKPKEKEIVTFREQGEIHQWMYDRVSLKRLLEEAGFKSVKVCGATESAIPDFASYNLDTDENGKVRKPDSLFMEGIK